MQILSLSSRQIGSYVESHYKAYALIQFYFEGPSTTYVLHNLCTDHLQRGTSHFMGVSLMTAISSGTVAYIASVRIYSFSAADWTSGIWPQERAWEAECTKACLNQDWVDFWSTAEQALHFRVHLKNSFPPKDWKGGGAKGIDEDGRNNSLKKSLGAQEPLVCAGPSSKLPRKVGIRCQGNHWNRKDMFTTDCQDFWGESSKEKKSPGDCRVTPELAQSNDCKEGA